MTVDLVAIIEAAYRVAASEGEWLANVVVVARPALDHGLGVVGFFYDLSNPNRIRTWSPVVVGALAGTVSIIDALSEIVPPALGARLFRSAPSSATLSDRLGADELGFGEILRASLSPIGVEDFLSVAATEPNGHGCLLGAPLPRRRSLSAREAATWDRVAAHLAAGARLRASRGTRETTADADAILSPSGGVEYADGDARSANARNALERSARAIERARGDLRRSDPEQALELWTALVSGRWTLVDEFDHSGRRYLVAKRNAPHLREGGHAPFTERERQTLSLAKLGHSNKLIAYELGLAPSTVATHLSTAAAKLGVRSRIALVRALRERELLGE